jgi:hypothetical protein
MRLEGANSVVTHQDGCIWKISGILVECDANTLENRACGGRMVNIAAVLKYRTLFKVLAKDDATKGRPVSQTLLLDNLKLAKGLTLIQHA